MEILNRTVWQHVSGGDCGCGGPKDDTLASSDLKTFQEEFREAFERQMEVLLAMAELMAPDEKNKPPVRY